MKKKTPSMSASFAEADTEEREIMLNELRKLGIVNLDEKAVVIIVDKSVNVGGSVTDSQINTGDQVNQTYTKQVQALDLKALAEFLDRLKQELPTLQLSEEDELMAKGNISTIQAQLETKKPIPGILKESLRTLRNVLEGATGSIVASDLVPKITAFLASL